MSPIIFASGNKEKFGLAQAACKPHGIELIQRHSGVDEIQSEDLEHIILEKTGQVYEKFQRAVIVSDDSWSVPALNGFPGPYMKSVNHWLTAQNWLDLMRDHDDKRIILIEQLAYQDEDGCRLFRSDITGMFVTEARGNYGTMIHKVITLPGDDGLTLAEVYDQGAQHEYREVAGTWQELIRWYTTHHAKVRETTI